MVVLHVKRGDESQFLYETKTTEQLDEIVASIVRIHNGRQKIDRLFYEIESLEKHGIFLPENMQGLTDEQISELKLVNEWGDKCIPSGGIMLCKDEIGRRSGEAPIEKMATVLHRNRHDAREQVSKNLVSVNKCLVLSDVNNALEKLKGAVTIVYPMGLPPHDPIKREFENCEDLSGTQASNNVLDESNAQLWWAGKELTKTKKLQDFIGKNEKTKIVVKLQKKGQGPPGREPVVSADEQKNMMAYYYKKQEEFKKLETNDENAYLNSNWSDTNALKRQFQGLDNLSWRPK